MTCDKLKKYFQRQIKKFQNKDRNKKKRKGKKGKKYFRNQIEKFQNKDRNKKKKKGKKGKSKVGTYENGLNVKKDYKYLISVLSEMKKARPTRNKKCPSKPGIFRNGVYVVNPRCHKKLCRSKDPTPPRRLYKDRIIEFGIVFDKYMFNEMKVTLHIYQEMDAKT